MYGMKVLPKLLQKKYREEFGCFLVEGKRGVLDAVNSDADVVQLVVTSEFIHHNREYLQDSALNTFFTKNTVLRVNEVELARLTETTTPQGIVAVVKTPTFSLEKLLSAQHFVVLEDIRDPGNLGTMIRTADWFGVGGILLVGGADPYQPKVVRSSMGSLFHVPILTSQDITDELEQAKTVGFRVVVTRPELADGSNENQKIDTKQKVCVVFGNEAHGTSAELDALADQSLSIPKFGNAESLNVAVSFGVVLYELKRQAQ
jgi:RNA methyltransferase, TrmH family